MKKLLPVFFFVIMLSPFPHIGAIGEQTPSFDVSSFIEEWYGLRNVIPTDESAEPFAKNSLYKRPDHISIDVWETVETKLLPDDHPAKPILDKIFSKPDINKNGMTLIKAGFRYPPVRSKLNAVVATHPKLKGHLIKTFTDEQPYVNEWSKWLDRIRGAELISEMIKSKEYHHIFKAPKKWIYLIPHRSDHATGKSFLLVVEDMKLEDFEKNKKHWKKKIKKGTLDALHDLLDTLGLVDSVFIDNIPFSRDGKIAFIDTEHSLKWPVPYHKLNMRLSEKNRTYWIKLTQR